jgi:hypothetical protein
MKNLRFRRTSDHEPAELEVLEIEVDGSFAMWRSTGEAVGRFAGDVPELSTLSDDVERALTDFPPSSDSIPMDASLERLDVDGRQLAVAAHERIEGPWGALLEQCRSLMEALRDQPLAALVIELDDPSVPRIAHRGTEALTLALIQPSATVVVWRDREEVGEFRGFANVIETVNADQGWQLEIPVDGVRSRSGDSVVAQIPLDAYHEGVPLRVHPYAVTEIQANPQKWSGRRPI